MACGQLTWLALHEVDFRAPAAPADAGSAWIALQHLELRQCEFPLAAADQEECKQCLSEALWSLTRLTTLKLISHCFLWSEFELPPALSRLR